MRSIRRTALPAAAVVLAVTLTACSSGDDSEASPTEAPEPQAPAEESRASDASAAASTTDGADSQQAAEESGDSDGADSTGEAGPAEAAGRDLYDLPDPIASHDIPAVVEGDDDATMTVDLFALKRQGETVIGQFG